MGCTPLLLLGLSVANQNWEMDEPMLRLATSLHPASTVRRLHSSEAIPPLSAPLLMPIPQLIPRSFATRETFLERYGSVGVQPHSALVIAQGGAARWQHRPSQQPNSVPLPPPQRPGAPLRQVLHSWRGNESTSSLPGQRRIVFEAGGDWQGGGSPWWRAMQDEVGPLVAWSTDVQPATTTTELVLSIGPSGLGLPRHTHGPAWLAVLGGGSKWWVIHPPSENGSPLWAADPRSALQWLIKLSAFNETGLPPGAQWCIQHAGEILFLPAYWHHATVNLGEVVAIGGQSNALGGEESSTAVERLQRALTADPANPRLLEAMSVALAHLENGGRSSGGKHTVESLELLLRAARLEPLNGRLALKAARAAHSLGQQALVVNLLRGAVQTLRELEDLGAVGASDAAEFGGHLGVAIASLAKEDAGSLALPLLLRAVETAREEHTAMTNKSGELDADDPELLYYLAYCHGRAGQRTEAKTLLRRVLMLDPSNADARQILGVLEQRS